MKRAAVRQRRMLSDGRRLVQIVCPHCGTRHWLPATTETAHCPRRLGRFTITEVTR